MRYASFALVLALVLVPAAACTRADARPAPVDGAQLFAAACARCHGESGLGGLRATDAGPPPRNFHDAAFQAARSDLDIEHTIVNGKNGYMPSFGATFDEAQLHALVRHLRSFDPRGQRR